MLLFTLEEFKNEVWISLSDNSKDEQLNLTIKRISEIIEWYLWYSLDQTTAIEYYDEWIVNFVWLQREITDLNSIIISEVSDWTNYSVDYFEWRIAYLSSDTIWGKLKIQYQTWYLNSDSLPADLKWVALSWWITSYNNLISTQSWNSWDLEVKTKKLWSLSLTYFSPKEISTNSVNWNDTSNWQPSDYRILDKYKLNFIY